MESCPVCGEQRRNSARFCTTCGHRFDIDEIGSETIAASNMDVRPESHNGVDPIIAGWPAPSREEAASPWAPPLDNTGGWPAPPSSSDATSVAPDVTWAEIAATALVRPIRAEPIALESEAPLVADDISEVAEEASFEASAEEPGVNDVLRERARNLVSELRDVIDGLTGESWAARLDLIGELEVSLTRPSALAGDALADLRATAEAVQARPRDLDTLTALTAQSETILALIVGYERASAGIERAIETLRKTDGSPTE